MKRFFRIICSYTPASLAFLAYLLCLSLAVLWVRSYYVFDQVAFCAADRWPVTSWRGLVIIEWQNWTIMHMDKAGQISIPTPVVYSSHWTLDAGHFAPSSADGTYLSYATPPRARYLLDSIPILPWVDGGLGSPSPWLISWPGRTDDGVYIAPPDEHRSRDRDDFAAFLVTRSIDIPHGYLILLLAIWPALWLRRWRRRRNRMGQDLCPACGYDCRASKNTCPECGGPLPVRSMPPL